MTPVRLREWDDKLRRDATDAINLLMQKGKIHPETFFEFVNILGQPMVIFWMVDDDGNTIRGSTVRVDAVEVIVAANTKDIESGRRFTRDIKEKV